MATTAHPINGPAPTAPAPTASTPGARQKCTSCGYNRDLADWPRDDKGVLRKTCIKCKEKRARHKVKKKKKQMEEAADDDDDNNNNQSAYVEDEEEIDGTERGTRIDKDEEDKKPDEIKHLHQRMMVDKISAEEAEMVGRDFFDRIAAMVAEDA